MNVARVNILIFKMNRILFANLEDLSFILFLFSLRIIHFKNVLLELLVFSLYPNNLIQANINVPILDYINGSVPLFNDN